MKKEIFVNSYIKRDGTHVREHYRTIDSDITDNPVYNGLVADDYENGTVEPVMYAGATPVLQGGVSVNTLPWGKIGEVAGEVLSTVVEVGSKLLPIATEIYDAINTNSAETLQNLKPQFNDMVKVMDTRVEQMKQNIDISAKELLKIKDQTEYSRRYKEFMKDYSVYKSTASLVNGLKINANSGNYGKMLQDIKGYAQNLSDNGVSIAKAQPVSPYEKYLNNLYKNTGSKFSDVQIANNGASSSMPNNVQEYQEIKPVGYEEIKPVGYEDVEIKGTTDKKLEDKWIMPCDGRISSPYGWRIHPVYHTKKFHNGIDIAVPEGTPIKAVADGTVYYAGNNDPYGYGNYVIITHSINGEVFTSEYGHLSSWAVKSGQQIKQGQIIGKSGNTGASSGPHCHLTIRKGKYKGASADPLKYIDFIQ